MTIFMPLAVLLVALAGCGCRDGWETTGTPPPDYDAAMRIIFARAPCRVPEIYCGSVEWVDWDAEGLTCGSATRRSGCAVFEGHEIRVLRNTDLVYGTALAHEVGHIFWYECFGDKGHPDAHAEWTREVNFEIYLAVSGL